MQVLTSTHFEPNYIKPIEVEGSKRQRDLRLDFFRGVGMFIILIAHIPNDGWALWIPARFGFSDATEMFVFQSGMASAIAFGSTFDRDGKAALARRTLLRIWQIYWAHIAVFMVVVAMMTIAGLRFDGASYTESLNLTPFIADPGNLLFALLTLRYVPNYFDILPMYIVILSMLIPMLFIETIHKSAPIVLMGILWLLTQLNLLNLTAEPWSDRPWFFNPFGWQLLFFTGFFLMRGTLKAPDFSPRLMGLAIAITLASVPFSLVRFHEVHPFFHDVANRLLPLTDKTNFGFLRFIHFLALCYIAVHLVGESGKRLRGSVVRVLTVVGQQSLAVFVIGMVIAQAIGIALDYSGRTVFAEAVGNVFGFVVLIVTAYTTRWFKSSTRKA
jgi:hypothetical protein